MCFVVFSKLFFLLELLISLHVLKGFLNISNSITQNLSKTSGQKSKCLLAWKQQHIDKWITYKLYAKSHNPQVYWKIMLGGGLKLPTKHFKMIVKKAKTF